MTMRADLHVLAIPGSLRRGSFNRLLLATATEVAPTGMTIEILDNVGDLPLFNEDLERGSASGPAPVRILRARVAAADGLLIATPEYNQSLSGVLKNAIDWLSRPAPEEVLIGKPVAVIGASAGRWGTRLAQAALRQVLTATECVVMPAPALFVREAQNLFDTSGQLTDEQTKASLRAVINAFGMWIERVSAPRTAA